MKLNGTLIFLLLIMKTSFSQDAKQFSREQLPAFFLDCDVCDQPFFIQEISYVNFVRDRALADIYSLLTENMVGTGAREYKLFLIGQNRFLGKNDTLTFTALPNAAEAENRDGILNLMKKGLLKYLVHTDLIHQIEYKINGAGDAVSAEQIKDKWNFWTITFNSRLNGDANSYQRNLNMRYGFIINRTTENIRTETGLSYGINNQKFKIDDSTTVTGHQSHTGGYHFLAFTAGKHLAVGQFATFFQSTQQNLSNSFSYYPAVEYNLFDYEEASRRQLRLIYRAGVRFQKYDETTIYNRNSEWLYPHAFVIQWVQIEKWGTINLAAVGWHYLNQRKNYSTSVFPSISFNPANGLRIGFWGDLSIVNDQFHIRRKSSSVNEILLDQIELKTDYMLSYGFNISYTFGSRYNNIINVRFDLNDSFW